MADDIRRRIAAGEFPAGGKLPALRALTAEYDVAEMTVHAAIRELQRQGLVVSSRGRGTFVSDNIEELDVGGGSSQQSPLQLQVTELRAAVDDLAARLESLESHAGKSTVDPDAKP